MPQDLINKLKDYLQRKKEERQTYAIMLLESEMSDIDRKIELKKTNNEEFKLLSEIYDKAIVYNT